MMSHKEDWLTKQFEFDFPISRYPEFLEILGSTPEQLEALVSGMPPKILIQRIDSSWSIQENSGHFLSVESLFLGRLEDYNQGAAVLRPARFEENQTDQADYNAREIAWILDAFRQKRAGYLSQLDALQPEDFGKTALHPRLNKPMRLCDMLHFHATHDRHHLARIEEILEELLKET